MEKDLSKDKRFIADLPKKFSMGEVRLDKDKPVDKKPSDFVNPTKIAPETRIQKALFIVDDIRNRTLNTLETLRQLEYQDALKLKALEQKLNDLKKSSDRLLDASGTATESDADHYVTVLNDVKDLLKDFKDTTVKGQTLEAFLEKNQLESHKRMLMEHELADVLKQAKTSLGSPLGSFIHDNIKEMSSTPLKRDASNVAFSFAGPLAPLMAMMRDVIPSIMDEVEGFKARYDALRREQAPHDPADVLDKGIKIDKASEGLHDEIQKANLDQLKLLRKRVDEFAKKVGVTLDREEDEVRETQKFKTVVLKDLHAIKEATEEEAKNEESEGSGLGGKLLGGLVALKGLTKLLNPKILKDLGSSLLKGLKGGAKEAAHLLSGSITGFFKGMGPKMLELGGHLAKGIGLVLMSPSTWAVAAVAIAGGIAKYLGSSYAQELQGKEDKAQDAFNEIVHPEGFKLSPENEVKAFGKQITPTEEKDRPTIPEWMRNYKAPETKTVEPKAPVATVIKPGKVTPRAPKELDTDKLVKGIADAVEGSKKETVQRQNKVVDSTRFVDSAAVLSRDLGILMLNKGLF